MEEVMRKAWEIADDEKVSHRVKIKALAFLVECYNSKLDTTVGGPTLTITLGSTRRKWWKRAESTCRTKSLTGHRIIQRNRLESYRKVDHAAQHLDVPCIAKRPRHRGQEPHIAHAFPASRWQWHKGTNYLSIPASHESLVMIRLRKLPFMREPHASVQLS